MKTGSKAYNILVIEDNPGDFTLVEAFLSEQPDVFTLLQAKSFKETQEILLCSISGFDVILLDLSLHDKTGLPLIHEIVALSFNIPIIVLTGYDDISFSVKSLSLGISDYLLKDDLTSSTLYKSIIYSVERKKSTLALEESEKKYSELFNLSPLPTYVFELDSLQFLDVNEAFLKSYGYRRAEILSMNLNAIWPTEEISALEASISGDCPLNKNNNLSIHKHVKKNREVIDVDIQSNFIKYKEKNAKVTIASDITERLNYISAMESQNEKLREISWIQSHVVRAPLSRIMGLIPLIKEKDEHNGEKEKMLDYLILSANELDAVIKDIIAKTRITDDNSFRNDSCQSCYHF